MFDDDLYNPPLPSVASQAGVEPNTACEPDVPVSTTVAAKPSPAETRFKTCRWHAKEDNGGRDYCSHLDVLPFTGKDGFTAEAWCPDCAMYKLRRSPKKRSPVDDDYDY
jgi:hypothetical protein